MSLSRPTSTIRFNIKNSTFCSQRVFIILYVLEQRVIISLYTSTLLVFRRFRKVAKQDDSFVTSVRPSVHMQQLDSHWKDIHEIWYLSILRKSVDNIQVSLNFEKNNTYRISRPIRRTSSTKNVA